MAAGDPGVFGNTNYDTVYPGISCFCLSFHFVRLFIFYFLTLLILARRAQSPAHAVRSPVASKQINIYIICIDIFCVFGRRCGDWSMWCLYKKTQAGRF